MDFTSIPSCMRKGAKTVRRHNNVWQSFGSIVLTEVFYLLQTLRQYQSESES